MISYAAMAIEAGQCDVAVVTFADNPKTGIGGKPTAARAATTRSMAGSRRCPPTR